VKNDGSITTKNILQPTDDVEMLFSRARAFRDDYEADLRALEQEIDGFHMAYDPASMIRV